MLTRLRKSLLFLGDLAALAAALFLTIALRYPQTDWNWRLAEHFPHFAVIFAIWLIALYINGLYDLNRRASGRKFFLATVSAAALSSLLAVIYFYLNVQSTIAPKTNLLIFLGAFILIFYIWRNLFQLLAGRFPKSNLAIIGAGDKTEKLLQELRDNPGAGYQTALIFKGKEELERLEESIKEKNIHAIILTDDFGASAQIRETIFACLKYNIDFFDYPDFYELLTGKVPVEAIDSKWFLDNIREGGRRYFNVIKRLLDFFGASLILIISSPLWPLIALGIKAGSRGPIFFSQERYGLNEQIFSILKFRTMRVEGNDGAMTAIGDKRITRFGAFLRQTRLDEIPQVINIIKGEMSFIGPRPERPELASELEQQIPFYKTRLLVKPGISGWDQVSGHYHSASLEDTREKLQYDLYYLKHRSLYLDLGITLKTIATMLGREGR